jgi:preprotein translocase subunit SecF
MSRMARLGQALYEGSVSIDFVGRRRTWYSLSAVVVVIALFGLLVPKLNMGIEFAGGVEYRVAVGADRLDQETVQTVRDAVIGTGIEAASSPIAVTSGEENVRIQTAPLTNDESRAVSQAIQDAAGVGPAEISQDAIGPSWGRQVAERAVTGLVVFLILILLLIWAYFREWKMSVAAVVALAHDMVITVGVYALVGFEVTPATVTGVLTILAFSLYDTVVVFDKVRENTANLQRSHRTYAEAANLAVNQTLVRSINTSIVALLPVGALLYAGVVMLGSGSLKDLGLAMFVGMTAGVYSSIFIATPLLVQLKELEPGVKAGDARALRHRSRRDVDPFAKVPVYTEDMAIHDDPGVEEARTGAPAAGSGAEAGVPTGNRPVSPGAPGRFTAGERPGGARPVSGTSAAGRPQPTRKPRSRRGKR